MTADAHLHPGDQPTRAMPNALLATALAAHRAGDLAVAERGYRAILAQFPAHFDALHMLGALRAQQRDPSAAVALITQAIAIEPGVALAHHNLAGACAQLGQHAQAIAAYRAALARDPLAFDSWLALARLLVDAAQPFEARAAAERAVALRPHSALAQQSLGMALAIGGDPAAARVALDRAMPTLDDGHTHNFKGIAALLQGDYDEAIAQFRAALARQPDDVAALTNLARALTGAPGSRMSEGLAAYRDFLERHPANPVARGGLVQAAQLCGAWDELATHLPAVRESLRQGHAALQPVAAAALLDDPPLLQRIARQYAASRALVVPQRTPPPAARPRARLRIGYVSCNFSEHPVGQSIGELLRRHDRARVEVIGIGTGANDGSALRSELIAACDEFYDVAPLPAEAAVGLVRALDLQVAVDLAGHTGESRAELFASRIAPVQANYFGFPGTWGHRCIDYLIADSVVIPLAEEPYYDEKVVRLPSTYFLTDTTRRAAPPGTRAAAGLPQDAVVLACFGTAHKILPDIYAAWLRVLANVPQAVLWLSPGPAVRAQNFRAVAARAGIDPERVVFAERVPGRSEYLARLALADLFLDTLPFNGHSTARDALLAGLPVLTCTGRSFAARVGASLVRAAGLPELVTATLADYEALAEHLARTPDDLRALRSRLGDEKLTAPLFDMQRRSRELEWAYRTMYERAVAGEPAVSFDVPSA